MGHVDDAETLWRAYWDHSTPAAETALFKHFKPLIRMVRGRAFSGADASYSVENADVEQDGAIGLLQAIRRFKPEMGRFETFANRYIWGKQMHGLKASDLTPKALAEQGKRWETVTLYGATDDDDEALEDRLADPSPDLVEAIDEAERDSILTRQLRRLTALQRNALLLCVGHGLSPHQAARQLRVKPARVREALAEALPLARSFLARHEGRFAQNDGGLNVPTKKARPRGRPAGRQATEVVRYRTDRERRERALRLAGLLGVSEAEVNRRGIDLLWERHGPSPPHS